MGAKQKKILLGGNNLLLPEIKPAQGIGIYYVIEKNYTLYTIHHNIKTNDKITFKFRIR